MATIIAADEIKKTLPGYSPEKAESFHKESARLADKEFDRSLKTCSEPTVILMAGGSASGKTEYVSAHLRQQEALVFDGTLPTFKGARIKIKKSLKAGKQVEVHLIIPGSLQVAFFAFLNRDRKFSSLNFYRTHAGARETTLEIAQKYPEISVRVFISEIIDSTASKTMRFKEVQFNNKQEIIEYLKENQYTEEDIRDEVTR